MLRCFSRCILSEQATTFTFLINRFDRVIIIIYIYTYNSEPLKIQICNRNLFQLPYVIIIHIYMYYRNRNNVAFLVRIEFQITIFSRPQRGRKRGIAAYIYIYRDITVTFFRWRAAKSASESIAVRKATVRNRKYS